MFQKIDWPVTIIPFFCIILLCAAFFAAPYASGEVLSSLRHFLGDTAGCFYLFVGIFFFMASIYIAFSRFGAIRLGGQDEKPKYGGFAWGSMMFTAGLAADIVFYSACEWMMYAEEPHIRALGGYADWACTYTLFHWGMIPWSFYLVLACAFGFMLHIRRRGRQKFSEACRPLLGRHTDGLAGRMIDIFAVFALLAGTATTFSVATPLMSAALSSLLGIETSTGLSIGILVFIAVLYTTAVCFGMKGIELSASLCIYLFFGLLGFVLFFGGQTRFILESGLRSLGSLAEHFPTMATFSDPTRKDTFAQDWTIFYWAYWIVWCVATPFFIGSISRGRTLRQVVLGGYAFGLSSTFLSFIVLGGYGMGLEEGGAGFLAEYAATGDIYKTAISMLSHLPFKNLVLVLLLLCMAAFYATSFDSITHVAATYSLKEEKEAAVPSRAILLFWALLLILLPVALLFSESSMEGLQSVSIIAAFPASLILLVITASFFRDAAEYLDR